MDVAEYEHIAAVEGGTEVDDDGDDCVIPVWGIMKEFTKFHWLIPIQRHRTKEEALVYNGEAQLVAEEGRFNFNDAFSSQVLIIVM